MFSTVYGQNAEDLLGFDLVERYIDDRRKAINEPIAFKVTAWAELCILVEDGQQAWYHRPPIVRLLSPGCQLCCQRAIVTRQRMFGLHLLGDGAAVSRNPPGLCDHSRLCFAKWLSSTMPSVVPIEKP